ncbi:aminopeptidase P family protein [Thermococcus aggregans]|uniref:Aminopeptidase P family protein n=1 Tax=Thermococcus aggregans TaxID=110163 RepID=A0A9E7SNV0_THEAG|nr:aminopeptidase P family protein [Thermococcus aggregans]USS40779.1 aminopeptidase P family protein [Thermococcus aggregans]
MDRMKKFLEALEEYDGALITPGSNLYYLTGMAPQATEERLFLLVVNKNGESVLIAPKLYENEVEWENVVFWGDDEDPYEVLERVLSSLNLKSGRILVEDTMRASFLIRIEQLLEGYTFYPLSAVTKEMRMRKGEKEIRLMKKAAEIADKVFYEIINRDLVGKTEKQVALEIEFLIRELADGVSFSPIVASGKNAANPHHSPGERKIRRGDFVILDFGARYKGYCSDITRTVAIGYANEKLKEIYEIVKEAQERAFQSVREGIKAKEVDMAARNYIASKGYGEYFIHRTGHGLGLEIHEEPYISQTNERVLENGMTFTIEPGIYVPNLGGVRIEDDVVVEKKGKRLTNAERELIIL